MKLADVNSENLHKFSKVEKMELIMELLDKSNMDDPCFINMVHGVPIMTLMEDLGYYSQEEKQLEKYGNNL